MSSAYQQVEAACTVASRNIMRAQLTGAAPEVIDHLRKVHRQLELKAMVLADQSHAARLASGE